jgi:hypothetical protein
MPQLKLCKVAYGRFNMDDFSGILWIFLDAVREKSIFRIALSPPDPT